MGCVSQAPLLLKKVGSRMATKSWLFVVDQSMVNSWVSLVVDVLQAAAGA